MHHLDPFAYLLDTVAALHSGRTDYASLTPHAVAAAQDGAAIATPEAETETETKTETETRAI